MTLGNTIYHIYYDNESDAVVMKWDDYATSEQFREGTEFMLRTLAENKATKVLADIKNMLIIGMEDQQWLERDFIPRAMNEGFKAIAIVKPDSYFNKVAVESISYKIDSEKLSINFFDSREDAVNWLRSF